MTGHFISFEGGEGTGKTTQVRRLASHLRILGPEVVETREPGGSPGAERIRRFILDPDEGAPFDPFTEALLYAAARAEHLACTIRPAMARGAWIVCDRFTDSSLVYQGLVQGADPERLRQLTQLVTAGTRPVLTVLLDMPVELAAERRRQRNEGTALDRFERAGLSFHQALREGYLALAAAEPGRFAVVDAAQPEDAIAAQIWRAVQTHFPGSLPPEPGD